jgi:alcohol dehydrogenase class IV
MTNPPELQGEYQPPVPSRVIFGRGKVAGLREEVEALGGRRVLLLSGRTVAEKTDAVRTVAAALGDSCVDIYSGLTQRAPLATAVEATTIALRNGVDTLVGVGGSTISDAARMIAVMMAEGITSVERLRELGQQSQGLLQPTLEGKQLPLQVSIPTTLSAGEFTPFAGITDEDARVKGLRSDPRICPRTVVLDPEVTLPTPRRLWATTGVKALDHAIEAIWSVNPQPVSDVLAVEAIRRLHRHLPASLAEPDNLEARGECQIAAWMSIFGITSVGVRLSHILGHQHRRALGCPARHHLLHHHPALHALSRAADAPAAGDDCRGPGHPHGRARAGGGGSGGGGRRGRVHPLARRADPPARCRRQK